MKFHVFALCICVVQICSGLDDATDETKNELKQKIRDTVNDVSDRFVDDLVFILIKMENRSYVQSTFGDDLLNSLSKEFPSKDNAKIDVKSMREYYFSKFGEKNDSWLVPSFIDTLKAYNARLLMDLPAERLNGILNLALLAGYPNATTEEIENTLSYLYGTESTETEIALLNIPDPTAADCPDMWENSTKAIDELKLMVGLKPKVIEDATTIRDKFPCLVGSELLEYFVKLMAQLNAYRSKIDVCTVEKKMGNLSHIGMDLEVVEYILPARLSDETFGGLMNFIKATEVGTPMDQIQKALEYLYDDVPAKKCES